MVKIKIFILSITLFYFSSSHALSAMTGELLLEKCQAAVENMDHPKEIDSASGMKGAVCFGYILGFDDMHFLASMVKAGSPYNYQDVEKNYLYCTLNISFDQKIRVIAKYLREHPDELDKPAFALLYVIFKEKFPCHKA